MCPILLALLAACGEGGSTSEFPVVIPPMNAALTEVAKFGDGKDVAVIDGSYSMADRDWFAFTAALFDRALARP